MKDGRVYLVHIKECIARIEEYVAGGRNTFMDSTLIQDAVIRNLQVSGESARRLSDETKTLRQDVDWRGIMGFRNVAVHDYLVISLDRVWEIVELNLPVLKDQVEAMLRSLEDSP